MLTTESGWYISPVFGDGNIQGLLGCFLVFCDQQIDGILRY